MAEFVGDGSDIAVFCVGIGASGVVWIDNFVDQSALGVLETSGAAEGVGDGSEAIGGVVGEA